MSIPPPRSTPTPPDGGDESPTGVYPATRAYARHIGWLSVAKAAGLMLAAIVVSTVAAWDRIEAKAETAGARQAQLLEPRLTAVEQLRVEVYDMRKENRSYWEAQRLGIPLALPPLPPPPPAPGGKDGGQ